MLFPKLRVRLRIRYTKLQVNGKDGSDVHYAGNLYCSSHKLHDILRDRHAKTGTLYFIRRAVFRSAERVKNSLQILLCHPVSVVLYLYPDTLILTGKLTKPDNAEPDIPALLSIFDSIGEKIDQYLIQPRLIAHQIFVLYPRHRNLQRLFLCLRRRTDDCVDRRDQIVHRKLSHREYDLPALNLGNIQNVVNQTQEMLSGSPNLLRIFPYLFRIIHIFCEQRRKSQDCIHRSTDIMGHIRKKRSLGVIGDLRRLQSLR